MATIGRFAVSETGMRELNSGRQPWDLVKELIQNAWDEAPFATECRVTVEVQPDGNATMITVEDDGPGFSDIADAYTLMGHTSKRLSPTKRGRFNIGEKDVISVAIEAEVETVGHTVTFPRTGSREEAPNSRTNGTVVSVLMPWSEEHCNELVAMLQRFIPPANCRLFINDVEVSTRPAIAMRSATLQTVAQNAPNAPLRTSQRRTDIHLVEPTGPSGERWLYEMGIPVQVIDCPWDIDVMQKIPMAQHRNVISEPYLNRIYTEALNAGHKMLKGDDFTFDWVKRALVHPRVEPEAVKSVSVGRYGRKAVFTTLDRDANMRAEADGYEPVDRGSLSSNEREVFRKHAGVKNSDEVFPTPPPPRSDYAPEPGTNQARFAEWVTEMAHYCDLIATVRYFDEPDNRRKADCEVSTTNPTLRFNEAHLDETFFQPPYGSVDHWDLLFHELGHALSNQSVIGHGEAWGEGVSKAGAFIAACMLHDQVK